MASFVMQNLRREVSSPSRKTSSKPSLDSRRQTHALLSIRPPYAEAIFRGEKRFEFRRAIFRKEVDVVVVYITSPISMVAGEFDVKHIISDDVASLWERTHSKAGIDSDRFFKYFAGREVGYAIAIGDVRRYVKPLALETHYGVRAPQSFLYL
jgi:predicted transcriptional regulator